MRKRFINSVVERAVVRPALAGELQVQALGPMAQAAAGLQRETPAEVFFLATTEVELVTQDQPPAALRGEFVVLADLVFAFRVFSQQGQQ